MPFWGIMEYRKNQGQEERHMQGKTVSETKVVTVSPMSPQEANTAGNVQGGVIMKIIDLAGGIVAQRHARVNVVTASVDRIDFLNPAYIGDVIFAHAIMNFVGRTSMEVGVSVESENTRAGKMTHIATAFLTYVALDANGRPVEVPPLILETEEDRRRHQEAISRREIRVHTRAKTD
jgi:acyl-CoA hydrolase